MNNFYINSASSVPNFYSQPLTQHQRISVHAADRDAGFEDVLQHQIADSAATQAAYLTGREAMEPIYAENEIHNPYALLNML